MERRRGGYGLATPRSRPPLSPRLLPHTIGTSKNDILALPPTEWGSEYAGLRDGNCIGPFSLPLDPAAPQAAIMCSVRFGSCLTGESDAETFVVPREAR